MLLSLPLPARAADGCPSCAPGAAGHRHEHFEPDRPKVFKDPSDPGKLQFSIPLGRGRVEGELLLPPGAGEPPVALLVPDFGPWDREGSSPLGVGDSRPVLLTGVLREAGFAVARYDKRGTAFSSGERNLPFSRHEQDAIAVYKFLRALDGTATAEVLLVGIGTGCLVVARICASDLAPRRAIEFLPPLPDFASSFARRRPSPFAREAFERITRLASESCVPFMVRSADPLAIYLATNPAESKELLERGDLRAREWPRCPTLVLHDDEADSAGKIVSVRVDPSDGAAARHGILRFLGGEETDE